MLYKPTFLYGVCVFFIGCVMYVIPAPSNVFKRFVMLQSILKGFARRCTATAKSTKQQCQCPAAFGCSTCRVHGARRPETIVKGKDCHFYKHGQSTRAIRKDAPKKLRELKQCEKLLADDKPIFELPFDTPIAKAINRASERELDRIAKNAVRIIDKKHKTNKKSPLPEK